MFLGHLVVLVDDLYLFFQLLLLVLSLQSLLLLLKYGLLPFFLSLDRVLSGLLSHCSVLLRHFVLLRFTPLVSARGAVRLCYLWRLFV